MLNEKNKYTQTLESNNKDTENNSDLISNLEPQELEALLNKLFFANDDFENKIVEQKNTKTLHTK